MTPSDARKRLETVIRFEQGRPVWDARDREAVLAVLKELDTLEARWAKYTDPGVSHPQQAPERIWVQWMPRLRNAVVYTRPPAILDGTTGRYLLSSAMSSPATQEGSPFCLDCGHPLTDADRQAPVCPYCGAA